MSSPAGLWSDDFLAQWMPSSTRAGVILNHPPDLTATAGHVPATGSAPPPRALDDSFASDFAPLPASADSSCFGVDGGPRPLGGDAAGPETPPLDRLPRLPPVDRLPRLPPVDRLPRLPPVDRLPPGSATPVNTQLNRSDEVANKSRDLPLMMKLDKLRKWQQHMQEQLKAHQLEELLQLQEEQQRLLGTVNESKHCNGESSGEEWDEDELHHGSDMNGPEVPQDPHGFRQPLSPPGELEQLSKGQDHEEDSTWNFREEDEEQSADARYFPENNDRLVQAEGVSEDRSRREENVFHDRPIRPGIGGQKQTFEELLEEQLRLEEQRLKSAQQQGRQDDAKAATAPPKRAFLKRGKGLSRFTNKTSLQKVEDKKEHMGQAQARGLSRSNSLSTSVQRGGSNRGQRLSVQRKTATLNKENRATGLCLPPQGNKAEGRAKGTKVLCSHQRQNTVRPESTKKEPELRKTQQHRLEQVKEHNNRKVEQSTQALRNCGPNKQPNLAAKQASASGRPQTADNDAAEEKRFDSGADFTIRTQSREEGGAPKDSFEFSFQEKLQRWECNKQLENMELGEFELLEQAAEELSFSSNSSFVIKVLQMDQQNQQLHNTRGLHQRRLSSTPIKFSSRGEARGEAQKFNSVQHGDVSSVPLVRADAVSNKVISEVEDGHDSERDDGPEFSDISSGGGSEIGEEVMVRGTICFPAPSNPPYDKRSYENEDSFRDSTPEVAAEDDEESDGVLSKSDDSTLIEDNDIQQGRVVFDDDATWNDLEDTAISKVSVSRDISPVSKSTANAISPVEKTLLRKVAVRKSVEADKEPEPDPPPASQLMTKLFPSLKPKAKTGPLLPPPADFESNKPKDDTGQQTQSRQLREKLVELEIEIERFKKENAALTKLRQENKKKQEDLRKQSLEFEQIKAEELAKFEEYRKEENRKLQKERKLFEKHASAARAIPDKKEREEIQSLKQQLSSLQEELKRKESRWASTHTRLRQQIDSLNGDNGSLRDEIRMLEKLRLSAWKKGSVSAENDTEKRDGTRALENNAPTLTKGVTFASPLDSKGSGCSPPQPCTATASRRGSKEGSQGAAGMKSSLKRSSGSCSMSSSSSSLPDTRESSPAAASRDQEKPLNHEHVEHCSPESSETEEPESSQEGITHPDGRIEKVLADGDRLIIFPNGTRKEISADGLSAKVTFFNGDTKQITADQRVIYYYAEAQTTHVTYPDGMEVLHFPNNQTEKHFPDGRKEITFPDQTVKNLFPDGREESALTDGTIIQVNPDGTKEIHFNTGQKEIHTANFKRREYLDGTVKTVYTDGRQETRYPTGRLRIKDKDGNVVLDNRL